MALAGAACRGKQSKGRKLRAPDGNTPAESGIEPLPRRNNREGAQALSSSRDRATPDPVNSVPNVSAAPRAGARYCRIAPNHLIGALRELLIVAEPLRPAARNGHQCLEPII